MRLLYPAAIAAGIIFGFCCPPRVPAETYTTPNGDISVAEGDCYDDSVGADPCAAADCPCGAEDTAADAGRLALERPVERPANFDALLAYAQEHYDPSVDCVEVLDRFCAQTAKLPELPQAEIVTAFTIVARFESHGKPDVKSPTNDCGSLQINGCHRRPMAKAGLDYHNEDDRVYWAGVMVAGQLAQGDSWWSAFSPWCVMRKHGRTIKADYARLIEGVE